MAVTGLLLDEDLCSEASITDANGTGKTVWLRRSPTPSLRYRSVSPRSKAIAPNAASTRPVAQARRVKVRESVERLLAEGRVRFTDPERRRGRGVAARRQLCEAARHGAGRPPYGEGLVRWAPLRLALALPTGRSAVDTRQSCAGRPARWWSARLSASSTTRRRWPLVSE